MITSQFRIKIPLHQKLSLIIVNPNQNKANQSKNKVNQSKNKVNPSKNKANWNQCIVNNICCLRYCRYNTISINIMRPQSQKRYQLTMQIDYQYAKTMINKKAVKVNKITKHCIVRLFLFAMPYFPINTTLRL